MTLYHFQMIDPMGGRRDIKSARFADMRDVWREIGALAVIRGGEGRQIRVTNEEGAIVILVGVMTARSLQAAAQAA
jgi:hypothetical protein